VICRLGEPADVHHRNSLANTVRAIPAMFAAARMCRSLDAWWRINTLGDVAVGLTGCVDDIAGRLPDKDSSIKY
jgi:hypothetical protein